jgi:hypothetical protein
MENLFGRCILSSKDTNNALYLSDSTPMSYQEIGGPALHIHLKEDEIFYTIDGEFLFQIQKKYHLLQAGDSVYVPKGTAHTFAHFKENSTGSILTSPLLRNQRSFKRYSVVGYRSEEEMGKRFSPRGMQMLMESNSFIDPPIDIDAALKAVGYKN